MKSLVDLSYIENGDNINLPVVHIHLHLYVKDSDWFDQINTAGCMIVYGKNDLILYSIKAFDGFF